MKVVLIGSLPTKPYRDRIKYYRYNEHINTHWNVNLIVGLSKIPGIEVHFLTYAPVFKTQVLNVNGDTFIHFLSHLPKRALVDVVTNYRYSLNKTLRYIRKIRPDLVHGIGTEHEGPLVAMKSGLPYVVTIHGVLNEVISRVSQRVNSKLKMNAKYESIILHHCKNIISINDYVLDYIENNYSFHNKILYSIPNPIANHFFQNKFHVQELYEVVFVGVIQKRKRIKQLLISLNLLIKKEKVKIKIAIVGSILEKDYYEGCVQYINSNQLNGYIEFLGQMDQAGVKKIIQESKLLVLPSIQETAPMVISEAMALGKPVIATDVGGIKYMIKDGETGFIVEPDNVEMLTEKIKILLENENLRKQMGHNASLDAIKKYHPDSVAKQTVDVYKKILTDQ